MFFVGYGTYRLILHGIEYDLGERRRWAAKLTAFHQAMEARARTAGPSEHRRYHHHHPYPHVKARPRHLAPAGVLPGHAGS